MDNVADIGFATFCHIFFGHISVSIWYVVLVAIELKLF
jgi:hypothetical protein